MRGNDILSLWISAIDQTKTVNERLQDVNIPDENDFAYYKNPEQYARDLAEYENLSAQDEDAEVVGFKIGYGGFANLRDNLAPVFDFHYKYDDPLKPMLNYPADLKDEETVLLDFFLHSDCDGTFSESQVAGLAKQFELAKDSLRKLTVKDTQLKEFIKFTMLSANKKLSWEFI